MKSYVALLASLALLQGCGPQGANAPAGFRLPSGNFEAGRKAFVDLRCFVCHEVNGVDAKYEGTPAARVGLGRTVTRIKSYAELVTSIINPSHKVAPDYPANPANEVVPGSDATQVPADTKVPAVKESPMAIAGLNDVMTVTQLVDLVAFLQPQYKVEPPAFNPYTYRYASRYH